MYLKRIGECIFAAKKKNIMKKHLLFTFIFILDFTAVDEIMAQTPEMFKYQAVLRDAGGNIVPSTPVTVVIDILQGSSSGTSVYSETHSITTTAQGVINLNIGGGSVVSGSFALINWSNNTYWTKVSVNGTEISNGQLLSVPYSLNVKGINLNPVNGFIGIGTMDPTCQLDVNGAINSTSATVNGVPVATTATTYWNGGAGSTINYTAGNVGIGTTNPVTKLDVNGDMEILNGGDLLIEKIGGGGTPLRIYNDDDALHINTAGTPKFYISTSGNVGIGTTSPTSKVHVVGSDERTNLVVESNSATFGPELRLNSTGGGHEWRIVSGSASNPYGAGSFELWDHTASTSRFGITATGNVGIGTTNPQNKLHVDGFIQLEGDPDAQVLFGTTGMNGKRGIGSLAGWDPTMLYVNGWGDFTGGVSVGHWGGPETSDLFVNGAIDAASILVNGVPVATTATTYWNGGAGSTINYTAGNVGIGTTNPVTKLDVNGDMEILNGGDLLIEKIGGGGTPLRIYNDDDALHINTAGTPKFYISTSGNVGIGTTSPTSKVHVVGSDERTNLVVESNSATFGPELRLNSTGGGHEWRIVSGSASNPYGAGSFELWDQTESASRFGITATGNVGIGTTNPTAKLDVAGTVKIVDGTQGADKVLTSDASGNAHWATNVAITAAVVANRSATPYDWTSALPIYTGTTLTLPAGKWSVQVSILIPKVVGLECWVRSTFTDGSGSSSPSGDISGASLASGYKAANAWGMVIGTLIIDNTSGSDKTYYYWGEDCEVYGGTFSLENFGGSAAMENQIIAYPMN